MTLFTDETEFLSFFPPGLHLVPSRYCLFGKILEIHLIENENAFTLFLTFFGITRDCFSASCWSPYNVSKATYWLIIPTGLFWLSSWVCSEFLLFCHDRPRWM